MVNWDWIISALIILFLILLVWSKIEKKTILELISDLKEFLTEQKEEKVESAIEYI